VFLVPTELVKILKRDLALAGIADRDQPRGALDIHALRHVMATFLSRAKVPLAVAQRIMRHSDSNLTLRVYPDVQKLDEADVIADMPDLPSRKHDISYRRTYACIYPYTIKVWIRNYIL
jgi:integrase